MPNRDRELYYKRKSKNKRHPLDVVRRARSDHRITDVVCFVSCGRDSAVALDLCVKHFDRVEPVFMYVVKGISFQERYLNYLENWCGLKIHRIPHWGLSRVLKGGAFRHMTAGASNLRQLKPRHAEDYVRKLTGVDWIATGEKYHDSLERNVQISKANGISQERKKLWPLAWWTHSDVQAYAARERIMVGPDYRIKLAGGHGGSMSSLLTTDEIVPIFESYPDDFEKIREVFPHVEAQVQRYYQSRGRDGGHTTS